MSKFHELHEQGQSVWLDFIRRDMLQNGELGQLIADGIRGVTSNPTIFQKAIAAGGEYDEAIIYFLRDHPNASTKELFENLAVDDIRNTADLLRPVFDASRGHDGFVSLEVSPHLANDTVGTVTEAERLWDAVDRPNLMIKVPATRKGIPAISELIGSGINVNVTLMFSLDHYESVAEAYIRGLDRAEDARQPASVASFFVSRVDSATDAALEKIGTDEAMALRGKAAVANSKLAYQRFQEIFHGRRFASLREKGAKPQRVLWASTSAKNPAYSDVLYVEELIGTETVNTMPPATIDAFLDHGQIRPGSVSEGVEEAADVIAAIKSAGVDFDAITDTLQVDGVNAFAASFDDLINTLAIKAEGLRS